MAGSSSNEAILQQLRHGIARFEIASSPVPSVSSHCLRSLPPFASLANVSPRFFARIGRSADADLPATKKVERYSVQRVTGDGRCLFRALVKGMALNKGMKLGPREERESADELRMAVKEVICDNEKERLQFEEALVAITVEESLRRYCQRIGRPDFWGGEAELLVLSKLCCQPIVVYIPEHELSVAKFTAMDVSVDIHQSKQELQQYSWKAEVLYTAICHFTNCLPFGELGFALLGMHGGWGSGFIPIQEYGSEFHKRLKKGKPQKVVRLLYSGRNHYDLLA